VHRDRDLLADVVGVDPRRRVALGQREGLAEERAYLAGDAHVPETIAAVRGEVELEDVVLQRERRRQRRARRDPGVVLEDEDAVALRADAELLLAAQHPA